MLLIDLYRLVDFTSMYSIILYNIDFWLVFIKHNRRIID